MRGRERAVRFDDLVRGNAGDSFERVDFFSVGAIIAK